jgi:hypothetical protein
MRFIFLFLTLFLLSSCTPRERKDANGDPPNDVPVESSDTGLTMKRTDTAPKGKDSDSKTSERQTQSPSGPQLEFTGPLHLQRIKSHAYILSESLLIGASVDPLSPLLEEREADYLVREFLNTYRKGRIARELLSEDAHPLFQEELVLFLPVAPEIEGFYLGTFRLRGEHSLLRVALISESGFIDGVMYMKKEGPLWSLQDWEMPIRNWPGDPVPREGDQLHVPGYY